MKEPASINYKVESSLIEAIGYDPEYGDLYIKFHSGTTYMYENVETEVFEDFKKAESKGKYFQANIKDEYDYHQV